MSHSTNLDNGFGQVIAPPIRRGGLRRKLFLAHLTVGAVGVAMLLVALGTALRLNSSATRLANLRGPTVSAATHTLNGIHRSLAALRGWIVLGDPAFKRERASAWKGEIRPGLARLKTLNEHGTSQQHDVRIEELDRILEALNQVEWRIEEVAQTPGNEPARLMLLEGVQPAADSIFSAITGLIDLEKEEHASVERKSLLAVMADFRGTFTRSWAALENFVATGSGANKPHFHTYAGIAKQRIETMGARSDLLTPDQDDLLARMQQDFSAFETFAEQVMAMRKTDGWNVARHLLAQEAVPCGQKAIKLLTAMTEDQEQLLRQDAARVARINYWSTGVLIVLIAVMGIAAWFVARHNADRITRPISALTSATQELAAGRLADDIPVINDDELGQLTNSFNSMRGPLRQNEAMNAELRVARQVQQGLLPQSVPVLPPFDIGGASYPAYATGGDYFDYLPLGDQEIGIVIGDASGHGVGPALVATDTHAYVRALTETQIDLANALSIANRLLCDEMVDGRFVTLLFVRLDARTRSLIYSSAGHHPTGYVLDTAGGLRTRLYSTGLPMGVSTDSDFPVAPAITLEPGDLVLLATDGIPETTSPDGTLFGMERALNVVRTHRHRRAQEIVEALLRAVQDFSQNTPRHDDITAVVVKVQPTARKDGFVQ